ncbi:MAG: hypothetical protein ACYTKD_24670 [Planctomycetota bacterium]|jgi:hypothetical protein
MGEKDRGILRDLAKRIADAAADPGNEERRDLWRRLNGLEPVRPPVFINEIPWNEILPAGTLECEDRFARGVEGSMRRTLHQWEHFPGDMVIDPVWWSPFVIRDSGYGLEAKSLDPDATGARGSPQFLPIMETEADVDRLQTPIVTHDEAATARNLETLSDAFGDILRVEKRGIVTRWFAPWDELVRYWSVERLYMDMYDKPDLVNRGAARIVDCLLARLEQWEEQGLLSVSDGNHRVGSNGLGITNDLPGPDAPPERVTPMHQWGTATGQIFSEVSPDQHWEFCLRHEMRWLERFGLNNYGCCEPLHTKVDILRKIPRLRKVSVSPKADKGRMAELVGREWVLALKPNPAIFAPEKFDPAVARAELVRDLEPMRGCCVEIVLKDITTVRGDPPRLYEWARIAREVAEDFAP